MKNKNSLQKFLVVLLAAFVLFLSGPQVIRGEILHSDAEAKAPLRVDNSNSKPYIQTEGGEEQARKKYREKLLKNEKSRLNTKGSPSATIKKFPKSTDGTSDSIFSRDLKSSKQANRGSAKTIVPTPQQVLAGTLTVSAPKEKDSIHLGTKDPPASAYLEGWWCSKTDLGKPISDLVILLSNLEYGADYEDVVSAAVDWEEKFLDKGWPFKLAGMQKSPTKTGLDAPPGGSKVYTFKYCYTADELKTVHDKLKQWITSIWKGTLIEGEGVDKEIDDYARRYVNSH